MAKIRFVLNQPAVTRWVATDPNVQLHLRKGAETYKALAVEASPVGTSAHWGKFVGTHGYFKRRFHIRPYRGGFRVYNRDAFAHLVEFGSVNNMAYAPFRRALSAWPGRHAFHANGTKDAP